MLYHYMLSLSVIMQEVYRIMAMKRYQVFGGMYRGRGKGYSEMVDLLAGLVNMEQMRRMGMEWRE